MKNWFIVIAIALFCSSTLFAQADDYSTDELMEMSLEDLLNIEVESTTKTKVNIRKAPGTVYSFSKEDFQNYGMKSIDDLYWNIPSVQPYAYKKNNVLILRGVIERFNNRTQHIVEGVVARNGYYNHEEFNDFIPLEWIESYEMIIGPGSALYGANAFSGVTSLNLLGFSDERKINLSADAEIDPFLPQFTATYQDKNVVIGFTGASGDIANPEYNITGEKFNQTTEYKM
ncbi:MAG: Plug domain-containing protein, partial [Calditrichia bacterium]|nr:Plug domain-containing protein [Calditrichia bacterium]